MEIRIKIDKQKFDLAHVRLNLKGLGALTSSKGLGALASSMATMGTALSGFANSAIAANAGMEQVNLAVNLGRIKPWNPSAEWYRSVALCIPDRNRLLTGYQQPSDNADIPNRPDDEPILVDWPVRELVVEELQMVDSD